jgi:leucyl aminopeptidase
MLDVTFTRPALPKSGALILLVAEGAAPSGIWQQAEEMTGGAISRAFAAAEFKGAKGKTCTILAPGAGLSRVVAVGLGKSTELDQLALEQAGGHAVTAIARDAEAAIAADNLSVEQSAHVALGAVLRAYRFDRYRTKEKPEDKPKLERLSVLSGDPRQAEAAWQPLKATAEGVYLSRDLVSEPPNVLNPREMGERCRKLAELGVDVEVFLPEELRKLGFGALLGVAQGSANEPRMVVMRWNGTGQDGGRPVAFIGKGVTFDTGGISIKPAQGMEDMKWDMAGAGTVIGGVGRPGRKYAIRHRSAPRRCREKRLWPNDRGDKHRRRGTPGAR